MARWSRQRVSSMFVCVGVLCLMALAFLVQQHASANDWASGHPSSAFPGSGVSSFVGKRAAKEHQTARQVLSPKQVGIPDGVSPEEFFENTILPSMKSKSGQQLVVDVGANVGHFAVSIAKLGFTGVSFEPGPSTCEKLKQNVKAAQANGFGQVRVVCAVVGGSNGTAHFAMPKRTSDRSFSVVQEKRLDTVEVPVVILDSEITPEQRVLLLKIDTQGHEMDVLAGARRLLESKTPRFLLVECSHILLTMHGTSPLQLMDTIAGYGYICAHLAFRGKDRWGNYGVKPQHARSRSFDELAALLAALPPDNLPGWTDLLCWDGLSDTPLWNRPSRSGNATAAAATVAVQPR